MAVLERSELRPRGAQFLIQPSGVRALEAISPELKQVSAVFESHGRPVCQIYHPPCLAYLCSEKRLPESQPACLARAASHRQLAPPTHHLPPPRPRLALPPQAVARHHLDHQVTRRFSHTGEVLYSSDNGSLTAAISERGELISLPWHVLQRELAAALPPGVLRTSHRFVRFAETADGVEAEFETADGGSITVEAGLLIGCDGSQSPVRQQLFGDGPPTFLRE